MAEKAAPTKILANLGYQAPAVQKAFELLKRVAESQSEISLSGLARPLGFSKGTTHGMIQALLQAGAPEQGPNRKGFFLGPAVVELAFRSWNYFRVSEHARPIMDALRDRIGETVFLGVLSRSRGLIMATAEAAKPLKISSPPRDLHPAAGGRRGQERCSGNRRRDRARRGEAARVPGPPFAG